MRASVLRWMLILCGCLWSFGLHWIQPALGAEALRFEPALSLPESRFHFGEVLEGTVVEHDFVVRNTGNEVLQIKKVSRD